MYTKADWEKTTIIKDSVHGYINVPKPIAKEIIDTDVFQRLKNIEQTGMQVLYPSATHTRFTHSLGVYHLSKKAFKHFKTNVQTGYEDVYKTARVKAYKEGEKLIQGSDGTWLRWELMFQLASLLHDSGHSPFSHTLEFVYDLPEEPETLSETLMSKCSEQFKKDFGMQAKRDGQKSVGKPHERMSALFVAMEEGKKEGSKSELQGGFRNRIKSLIESYMKAYGIFNVYEKNDKVFDDDIEFMVRMIIGCFYELDEANNYVAMGFHGSEEGDAAANWRIELQIRNCIISMLNSKLDVDNLDYVVRDSKYSGYASNSIDLERLLSSFTIINAYQFDTPIYLNKNNFFDASVNLDMFEGKYINAKVSGECMISSDVDNLSVKGNIVTDTENLSPSAQKKIFRTKESFSANILLTDERNVIKIKPKNMGQKAYLNISGYLEGNFCGTILGDTCQEAKRDSNAKHLIFFAYKQNCMSVLMSAIDGSNFENKWVYAHHTTTFKNNYLTVYLLERYAEYLVDCEVMAFLDSMEKFLADNEALTTIRVVEDFHDQKLYDDIMGVLGTHFKDEGYNALREFLEKGKWGEDAKYLYEFLVIYQILERLSSRRGIDKDKICKVINDVREVLVAYGQKCKFYETNQLEEFETTVYNKYRSLGALEMQCFAQIMSMFESHNIQGHYFYRTDDQDLLGEYKKLYQKLSDKSDKSEKYSNYEEFMITYRHMITRTSMRCLWKSYPEFYFYFSDWTKTEKEKLGRLIRRTSTPWGNRAGEKQLNYAILSDYVQLSNDAKDLWNMLKDSYGLTRLVYVEQKIKTKHFKRHETYISNRERVVRLEDVRLYPDHQNDEEFFYIFYELDDKLKKEEFTPNSFQYEIRKFWDKDKGVPLIDESVEVKGMDERGNVVIRDNIHGDIVLPPLFKAIIDTKEFQRLRRIKQLATAGQVFPGAVHTRFSHSIGTYHIMRKILTHFKEYFKELYYSADFTEIEENAILAAALLHDVGHGPYSHTFERTNLLLGHLEHEQWTVSIIKNPGTEIHSVLESVEKGFADKVASYIECEKEVKKGTISYAEQLDEKLNLKFIFASLVSGQIDADRMDYLLRDAEFSGVKYGQFDLEKLIEGLAVSVSRTGRYRICIKEQYLSVIEGYFYARYQMYNNVYYHPHKVFSEALFCKILHEAQKAVEDGHISNNMIPVDVEKIFTQAEITEGEYCKLDDSVIDGAIQTWAESGVKELAFLCKAKLNRRFYERLKILNYERFESDAKEIFNADVFNKHFLIYEKKDNKMYDPQKPVYILRENGVADNFEKCSDLTKEFFEKRYIYYSREMAEDIYGIPEDTLEKFEQRLKRNCVGSNMEIEKKYVFTEDQLNDVKQYIHSIHKDKDYTVDFGTEKQQIDTYFDTQDLALQKDGYALRIRESAGKIYITCKRRIESESNGIGGQLEREENEEVIVSKKLADNRELVEKFLKDIPNASNIFDELQEKVRIYNKRTKAILKRRLEDDKTTNEMYEASIDDVEYENLVNQKRAKECQLEIELKSSYQYRPNMKKLTDRMELDLSFLSAIEDSKYQRALRFTE